MDKLYSIKNKIVQTSLKKIESILPETNDKDLDIINKTFHTKGTITYESFLRSCIYLSSKNNKWSFKNDHIVYHNALITPKQIDGYFKDINENYESEHDFEQINNDWNIYTIEGIDVKTIDIDINDILNSSSESSSESNENSLIDNSLIDNSLIDNSLIDKDDQQIFLNKKIRTYDLYIFYDKYYQTPRLFIVPIDEDINICLLDITNEYINKVVTIETNDKLGKCISIHPCGHSNMIKKIIHKDTIVEEYLIYFLQMISSIIPIEI